MVNLGRVSVTVLMLVGLTACKVEQQLEAAKEYVFRTEKITEIGYSKGGGLPQPGVAPFTRLGMSKTEQKVMALLITESCEVRGEVPVYDFNSVAQKIERSGIKLGELLGADMGYETVKIVAGQATLNYHLKQGDGSHGEPVLVDGAAIAQDLNAIANRLKQQGCNKQPPKPEPLPIAKYKSVGFTSEGLIHGPVTTTDYIPVTPEISFSIDFYYDEARFHGTVRRFAIRGNTGPGSKRVEVCRETFEKRSLGEDLRKEANMISFVESDKVCQKGSAGRLATAPQLSTIIGAAPNSKVASGGFDCQWKSRAKNYEPLLKKVKLWLEKNSKCFDGSIL